MTAVFAEQPVSMAATGVRPLRVEGCGESGGGGGEGGIKGIPLGRLMVPSSFCSPWQADPQDRGCWTALPSLLERPSSAAAIIWLRTELVQLWCTQGWSYFSLHVGIKMRFLLETYSHPENWAAWQTTP